MKSIIEKNNQIPDMYNLRHKHDDFNDEGYNYVDNVLKRSTSSALWQNDNMNEFLSALNDMYVTLIDTSLPTRNIFYFTYNKYFNGHGK
jgi:hypothetical protein